MLGLKKEKDKYIFKVASRAEKLMLNLYRGSRRVRQIPFDPGQRIGDVWRLALDTLPEGLSYAYEADGRVFTDPNGVVFSGRKKFGSLKDGLKVLTTDIADATAMPEASEEWQKDRPLNIPYHESIIYRLHVRGFTQHKSSGLATDVRGTFQGIIEKIPYLKSLGINCLELMPCYEFNEIMLPERHPGEGCPGEPLQPTGLINYWGFTKDALQLAPKASYTSDHQNPRSEFRKLVLALHQNGIELVLDFYFTQETLPDYITTVMRYWRIQYHLDGIHLIGYAPYDVIARDPYLSRFKLWADSWEGCGSRHPGEPRYLADYNDGFQNDMRRVLKGDEGMLGSLMDRIRRNPADHAEIQYMANVSGMTLRDMLCYDRKHNEANHEQNRDGTDQNYSWNCGEEGESRRKSVRLLRRKMFRNAVLLLLLSQGTPLICAGDEFGATKKGNNNAYCQDNEINWLNWGLTEKNQDMLDFFRKMLAFRKAHPVFHQPGECRMLDYQHVGIPDLSFHGETAWRPEMEGYRRQLGIMYAGEYAGDDSFLVLCNFHWEKHSFALPHPPLGRCWAKILDTAEEMVNGILPAPVKLEGEHPLTVTLPRSMVVLQAMPDESYQPKKARRKKNKAIHKEESGRNEL